MTTLRHLPVVPLRVSEVVLPSREFWLVLDPRFPVWPGTSDGVDVSEANGPRLRPHWAQEKAGGRVAGPRSVSLSSPLAQGSDCLPWKRVNVPAPR